MTEETKVTTRRSAQVCYDVYNEIYGIDAVPR